MVEFWFAGEDYDEIQTSKHAGRILLTTRSVDGQASAGPPRRDVPYLFYDIVPGSTYLPSRDDTYGLVTIQTLIIESLGKVPRARDKGFEDQQDTSVG